jgi:hypothetical protein
MNVPVAEIVLAMDNQGPPADTAEHLAKRRVLAVGQWNVFDARTGEPA